MKSLGPQTSSVVEVAEVLARGYLRFRAGRVQDASNPACCPRFAADRSMSNCLDVAAHQSDELGAVRGGRRPQCKPA